METGNRVSKEQINALMNSAEYTDMKLWENCILLSARFPSGFVITETSACVDPANYDHDLGVSICLERIEDKLWMLEGYLLANANCGK